MTGPRPGQAADERLRCALLQRVLDLTVETGDVAVLAGQVAELVRGTTGVDVVFVYVLDDDDRQLTLTGATHPFVAAVGTVHLPLGEGVSGWVASRRTPVVLPDGKVDDARWRRFPQLRGDDFRSMASVPLDTPGGEVVGVLNVHTVQRREWDAADMALLRSTARLVAGAVHTARLLRHLDLRQREQQALSTRLVQVAEQERARLARELHDGVAQRIAAMSFHLSAAQEALPDDLGEAGAQLRRAAELLDLTAAETRSAVRALRPPLLDDLGLPASLHALARDLVGLETDIEVEALPLTPDQETALYRIAQEALHNVVKHAGARRVRLHLRRDGHRAVLEVRDDGCGGVPDTPGATHGVTSMRDRAGLLGADIGITGRPGQGTTVRVSLPL